MSGVPYQGGEGVGGVSHRRKMEDYLRRRYRKEDAVCLLNQIILA